jgi:HSP20 family protein
MRVRDATDAPSRVEAHDEAEGPTAKGGTMPIVKWTPFAELESMERRMRRLVDELGFTPSQLPAADVYETDDEFVVELEVPGYEEQELTVEVSDHTLAVKGERARAKEEQKKEFALHERLERMFERRFALPTGTDTEHVTATFGKGVLEVHAPKARSAGPKQVEIGKA